MATIELKTAKDIAFHFEQLTADQKKELGIRQNFNARAIFEINRKGLQGTISLSNSFEYKEGEEWVKVGEKEVQHLPMSKELVLLLTQSSMGTAEVQKGILDYFGEMPDLTAIGS
jgi:hypothetical protein